MNNRYVLGTMNIEYKYSSVNDKNDKKKQYRLIIDKYINDFKDPILDTAYYYGNTKTEEVLGSLLNGRDDIKIATKANPWYMNDFTNGKLGRLGGIYLENQLNTSLKNLRVKSVECLYLHCPDYETNIYETINKCDELWRKERFNHLGISNYSKDQLIKIFDICDKYEFVKPKYYQGMYNVICRKVEEIFPIIEEEKMIFWAYNPLAGGLLTGKYRGANLNSVGNSRFKDNQIYQNIFWKKEILNSLVDYWQLGDNNKCIETAYQWLNKYSELRDSDKIIVGVSSVEQLENNIELFKKNGGFNRGTTELLDSIYNKIIDISPNYYY